VEPGLRPLTTQKVENITTQKPESYPKTSQKLLEKNYAQIGFTYNEEIDGFISPKPAESWILNKDTGLWEAPVPYPEGTDLYVWDESSVSWVLES